MTESTAVNLPAGWTAMAIERFARTATGGTPSRTVAANFGGAIPWVKSGELGDGVVRGTEETLTQAGLDSSSARVFPRGTLCIALYGATVGKVGILDVDAATNQAVCGIFLPKDVDTRYLFYFLLSKRRALIEQGKGGAQSNISNAIVRETIVPLAPYPEQRRIVAKIEELFSDLDAGVAALERVRANLKRYRAAVLKAAVEGRLTEEWRKHNPVAPEDTAAKLLERILLGRRAKWEQDQLRKFKEAGKTPPKKWKEKYEEPPRPKDVDASVLPASWCWVTIDQLIAGDRSSAYGVLQPGEDVPDGVPLVRVCDVADGRVAVDQLKRIAPTIAAQFARTVLRGGEVLLTIVGTIGRTAIAPESLRGANTARAVAVLPTTDLVSARFVEMMLRDSTARTKLTLAAHEVARKTLNLEDVRIACVPLGPLAEQSAIVAEVDRRLSVADAAEQQIEHALQRAARLRQSILKRAFEGRLVPQDSADEPATKLLERTSAATNGHRAVIETSGTQRRDTPKRGSRARA